MHKRMRAGKLATRLQNPIHSGSNARAYILEQAGLTTLANSEEALNKDQTFEVDAKGVNVS
jgi:hypothetical protein